jgi:hypothetical protein
MLIDSSRSSLVATLIIGQLLISIPEFAYFAIQSSRDGSLTLERCIYLAGICAVAGIIFSVLIWATVFEPLRKRRVAKLAKPGKSDSTSG